MLLIAGLLVLCALRVESYPTTGGLAVSGSVNTHGIPPLITLDDGLNVGVNLGGLHASAGLGGLLTGDLAKGGLHASAGTPFGQHAAAGLGGAVGGSGRIGGGLFAGATSGGGVGAAAGLGGAGVGNHHAVGSFHAEGGARLDSRGKQVVVAEKNVRGPPEVQRTIIEKTIIPNYVEKKVQETQYVEKTIKVPQVVEKTVRVPVAPTVIEKEINVPQKHANAGAVLDVRSQFSSEAHPPASVGVVKYGSLGSAYSQGSSGGYYGAGSGGFSAGAGAGGYGKGGLFTDIFNIPISTLGAVSNLLSGITGGGGHAAGGFEVNKAYTSY